MKNKSFTFFLLVLFPLLGFCQDDLLSQLQGESADEKVIATFKTTKMMNAQTSETVGRRVLDFRITHRFGNMGGQSGGSGHNLWGFDNASNIRFSFDYGITEKLQAGFGRSKFREQLDLNGKYRLLHQTERKIPVSVTLFSIAAYTPESNKIARNRYKRWEHRLSYSSQVIIARKFSNSFSFEILPTYVHRNLVDNDINPRNEAQETNDVFALGFAGRLKITKRVAFVADYFRVFSPYRYNNFEKPFFNPLSAGVEIETGGHVFHINMSNSAGIIDQDFIAETRDSWLKGGFKLGFHISRVFHF